MTQWIKDRNRSCHFIFIFLFGVSSPNYIDSKVVFNYLSMKRRYKQAATNSIQLSTWLDGRARSPLSGFGCFRRRGRRGRAFVGVGVDFGVGVGFALPPHRPELQSPGAHAHGTLLYRYFRTASLQFQVNRKNNILLYFSPNYSLREKKSRIFSISEKINHKKCEFLQKCPSG